MSTRTVRWFAAALFCVSLAQAGGAGAADLTVRIEGVRSAEGEVRLGLYDRPEEFPRGERRDGGGVSAARRDAEGAVEYVFAGLEPGRYAVAIYHDEDGDGEFDKGLFGIPREGFGFSNGASAGLGGAPDFDEAAVTVEEAGGTAVIQVSYW